MMTITATETTAIDALIAMDDQDEAIIQITAVQIAEDVTMIVAVAVVIDLDGIIGEDGVIGVGFPNFLITLILNIHTTHILTPTITLVQT